MIACARLDAGGGVVAHLAGGPGAAVLWVHGYTMDSRIWDEIWSHLAAWRHIGIDLPGHGQSSTASADVDLVGLARRIGAFAIAQGVRHLVGLSFGGMVVLQIAIEFPNAFTTLVVGAPALGGGPQDRGAQALHLGLTRAYRARGRGPWLSELWLSPGSSMFAGIAKQPARWQRLRAIVGDHAWSELADGRMQRLTRHPQTPRELAQIAAAALVLIGDEDADAFKRSAELIRRAIPGCRRVHLEQTGHLTFLERAGTIHALLDAHFRAGALEGAGECPTHVG